MFMAVWLRWWYSAGWARTMEQVHGLLLEVLRQFSVVTLINTLFAPWKRIESAPGASLDAKLRAFGDNLVSRAVGFCVRVMVLLTAVVAEALAGVGGAVWIV